MSYNGVTLPLSGGDFFICVRGTRMLHERPLLCIPCINAHLFKLLGHGVRRLTLF